MKYRSTKRGGITRKGEEIKEKRENENEER
jgi:hypothetical protein